MKDLSRVTLDKIKKKKIKPFSKWKFLLKNYFLWFVGVLSVLVGGLSSSVVFYILINNDWDIYKKMSSSLFSFIFLTLPYFWLIFLVIFVILADYYLKHTKYGYRFSLLKVVSASVFASIILGGIFYNIGMGKAMETEFSKRVPGYDRLFYGKEKLWMQAENGLLVGLIIEVEDSKNFVIMDLNNNKWKIEGDDLSEREISNIKIDSRVRIIGKIKNDKVFIAKELRFRHEGRGGARRGGCLFK